MSYNDVFQEAALIQLSASCWIGSKSLHQGMLKDIGNAQWLRGKKLLINPELLGSIKTTIHKARQLVNRFALPFPLTGLYLVPKESIDQVDAMLEQVKDEYWAKVNSFISHYEDARDEARKALGELFSEADYPMDIRSKFRFDWRFLLLDVPGKASILPPEVYEREKQKFQMLMEEAREMSIAALREEFAGIVQHLVERVSDPEDGKPKTIRSSMMNKMNEFLDAFQDKNLFSDDKLEALVSQARTILGDIRDGGYGLNYNEMLRKRVQNDMQHLKEAVDAAVEELPRRKIRLDQQKQQTVTEQSSPQQSEDQPVDLEELAYEAA